MKKLSSFLLVIQILLLLTQNSFSQNEPLETFNEIYYFGDSSLRQVIKGVVELNDGILVYGNIYHEEFVQFAVTKTTKNIDSIVWQKEIGNYEDGYAGYELISMNNNTEFVITGSHRYTDSTGTRSETFLMKMDTIGNIIWNHFYDISNYSGLWSTGKKVIRANDGGFLVIGGADIMGVVIKTDSVGNKLWDYTIGQNSTTKYVYLRSCVEMPDSGYMIGGNTYNGHDYYSGRAMLYKFTESGELIRQRSFGGFYKDRGINLTIGTDSCIIGAYELTTKITWWGDRTESKVTVFKLDREENVLWEKSFGDANKVYWVSSIEQLENGNLLLNGQGIYLNMAWLFHTSEDGDSLALKYYTPDSYSYNMYGFNNMVTTSDNGIILSGEARRVVSGESIMAGWIVKTDIFGCLENINIIDQPGDLDAELGNNVVLVMNVTCSVPVTYQWFKGNELLPNAINDTLILENISASDADTYYCQISNDCETIKSDSFDVIILYDGVNEQNGEMGLFSIRPNPAKDVIRIRPFVTVNETVKILITTMNGINIKCEKINRIQKDSDIIINISSLNSGIYIITLMFPDGVSTSKFMKTN